MKFVKQLILGVVILLLATFEGVADTDTALCQAIFKAEGGYEANQLFGINPKYVICNSYDECEQVCLNTVKSKRKEYYQLKNRKDLSFLEYLAKRYCPENWEVWLKNVKWFLNN